MMAEDKKHSHSNSRAVVSDRLQLPKEENISDHGCNKHRLVYSKGREYPGSEKNALNKFRSRQKLVSQKKTVI